ncbi:EAL domain-containing protein [Desulfogranum marinum]|uniref:EAL domain-containing protein n=1 Tax=Desulfogranum marinum TaxID=453220 RepID=UPI00196552D4|nr:EAL domain-containing protein [Desulfogranum marinum]MBM9512503.1 EAL domain-containing protein [Desulfogranum marinum]
MKTTSKQSALIFAEQVKLLYTDGMVIMFVSLLAGTLLCWSQREVIEHVFIFSWFSAFVLVSISRVVLFFLYNKTKPNAETILPWYRYFLIGTYCAGIMWGMASFFLFPLSSQLHQMVFFLVLVGISAGAFSTHCSSLPVVIGFQSIVLLPLAIRMLMLQESEGYRFIGLLVLILWAVILSGAKKIHGTIRDNIDLRLESIGREKALKTSEERYRHIFNSAPVGILHYDTRGIIVDCNKYFADLLGSTRKKLFGFAMLTKIKDKKMIKAVEQSLIEGSGYFEGDYRSVTGNQTTPVRAFFKAIQPAGGDTIGGVGIVEDFTDKKLFEEKLYYHATFDFLTGLPNRRLLLDKLSEEMSRATRHGYFGALLFIDLDNFKTINDSLGHSIGDELLKLVAKRIKECIRQEDSAARMGGDEFVVILTELDSEMELAANKAGMISEEIRLCLSAPCKVSGYEMHTGLSIGVSLFPKPEKGVDDILKQADSAMYKAKEDGRNTIRFFSPHMQKAADKRLQLTFEIKNALNNNEFTLYYQPQVDRLGNLIGAEGLLRWNHPQRGVLAPGFFLDTAEENGLMADIDRWVLESACEQIKSWSDDGLLAHNQTISINISGKNISEPNFLDTVHDTLMAKRTDPVHLGIELTEGSLISISERVVKQIVAFQGLGIKFSIDDFGTGYSSLNYLNKLPINTLKIDRSFVNEITGADQKVVLIDTIIIMAQNLGLEIIAEGVESEIELSYLNSKGCSLYQGYFFSKPVPTSIFSEMLKSAKSGPVFLVN